MPDPRIPWEKILSGFRRYNNRMAQPAHTSIAALHATHQLDLENRSHRRKNINAAKIR
jgi:hypothetical protein